jgi:hypothetical protein
MTDNEMKELINKYVEIAYDTDSAAGDSYSGEVAGAAGVIQGLLRLAYEAIPADHHLKTWIPNYLKEKTDEVGQKFVMRKLES